MNPLLRPSALLPPAMSMAALVLIAAHIAFFGTAPQPDEGTSAHLWQLLMAGQLPVIVFFAFRWLPAAPGRAFAVLLIQFAAACCAAFPVWYLGW